MIQWKEEYRIGVEMIDEQHKKLFEIANRAYGLLKNDLLIDKFDHIVSIFQELKDYTVYHFRFEEEYMASIAYRKRLSHKVYHDDFIEKMQSIDLDKMDENQEETIMEVLEFVARWIEGHILGEDTKYVSDQQKG